MDVLAIVVPASVAVLGLFAAYENNLRLARRQDQLARLNAQLSEFYGPLLALVSASNSAWSYFRSRYRTAGLAYWDPSDPPTEVEVEAWRHWMSEVFMPLNRETRDLVMRRAHLLVDSDMPPTLLALCAHVSGYEAIVSAWDRGDFTENKTSLKFPGLDLLRYAQTNFAALKAEQEILLGTPRRRSA